MSAAESQSAESPRLHTTCPQCGDANTQPSHAVYNAGTSNIATTTRASGIAISGGNQFTPMIGSSSTSGVQQTQMAAQCSPPAQHVPGQAIGIGIILSLAAGIVLWVLCFGFTMGQFLKGTLGHVWGWLAFLGPGILLMKWQLGRARRMQKYNRDEWPTLHAAWQRKWICHKCHHQFDPAPSSPSTNGTREPTGAVMPNPSDEKSLVAGGPATPAATPPSVPAPPTQKPPWHDRTGLVVLLLIFLWPIGVWGLIASRRIPKSVKWGVCGFFALLVIASATGKHDHAKPTAAGPEAAAVTAIASKQAVTSHITKTLDEFRAEVGLGLERDPDTTGTSQDGNQFYTWKNVTSSTTIITDKSTPRVLQINVLAMRANGDAINAVQKAVIVFPGIYLARRMIAAANNETHLEGIAMDDIFSWLGQHYDKEGATRTAGNVMVTTAIVSVKDNFTFTTFKIY